MKKNFTLLLLLLLISACASKGNAGEKCLEGSQCSSADLACNSENRCETCGGTHHLCCGGNKCLIKGDYCEVDGFCQPCGIEGSECCVGGRCSGNSVCSNDNFCEICGSAGSPCCPGKKCDENLSCNKDNFCEFCGQEIGSPCCPGNENKCLFGACDINNICVEKICDESGSCRQCGRYEEPCCEGGSCEKGYLCNAQSTCEYCGELFTPPCEDYQCIGWYIPVDNVCSDPFEKDPGYDISICQDLEPGYKYSTDQDWCLWSAAFYKKDASLCSQISWDDMVHKCQQGEDPNDYYLTTTYQ